MAVLTALKSRRKDKRRLEAAFATGVISSVDTAAPGFSILRTIEEESPRLAGGLRWREMTHRKTVYRSDETDNCFMADTAHDGEGYWALDGITYVGRWRGKD